MPSCTKYTNHKCPAQTRGWGDAMLGTFCPRECFSWVNRSEIAPLPLPSLPLHSPTPKHLLSLKIVIQLGCTIFKYSEQGFRLLAGKSPSASLVWLYFPSSLDRFLFQRWLFLDYGTEADQILMGPLLLTRLIPSQGFLPCCSQASCLSLSQGF